MSVTWITPPNSTLGSTSAPVVFRVDGDAQVPAISVSVVGRAEERAYREGQFVYPYLESVRTVNQFELRRTGGWLGDFVLHVDECESAAGPYVIDGSGNIVFADVEAVVP